MTQVTVRLPNGRLDISVLNVSFAELPIASASPSVVRGFGGDLDELGEALRECFADGASWCRIGNTVHTVTDGDAEFRLIPQADAPNWHVDQFPAGWGSRDGKRIPPEHRLQYARYVDRRSEAREACLQGKDLRAAAAKNGPAGVDRLVRHHCAQLAEWHEALDELIRSVQTAASLPKWAETAAKEELLDWHRTREYLTSAVLEYHHGDTGPRPETVWGNLCFEFSTVSLELVPNPSD
ncbi:hypothetical protein [Streptomyces sp. NPDC055992]|uniref:hypothetical protein n=1 Tax=Streptomyces sp. NPDC055992 TaxID=3345673 RepID=UPI0035E28DDB